MSILTLSARLIGGFMLVGVMVLVGGSLGLFGITQVSGDLKIFSEIRLPAIHALEGILESQKSVMEIDQSLLSLDALWMKATALFGTALGILIAVAFGIFLPVPSPSRLTASSRI